MAVSQDSKFAYAVGRIRVLEMKLLDQAKMQRMLEAKTPEEAFHVLAETEYADLVALAKNPHQFELVTTGEIRRVYELIRKMLPKEPLTDLFCVKYDIHNLKVLLKAEYQAKNFDHLLMDVGLVPVGLMKFVAQGEEVPGVPERYLKAAAEARQAFEASRDPKVIDTILDRELYSSLTDIAKKNHYDFYAKIITDQIDLANLRSMIRAKRMGRDKDYLNESLLPGGAIPVAKYLELIDANWEQIITGFANTPHAALVKEGIVDFLAVGQLTLLEKLIDDKIMQQVKQAKYLSLGPEPVIGYLMAKETEVRNIRIIMVGKLNDVSTDVIRERLRDSYV